MNLPRASWLLYSFLPLDILFAVLLRWLAQHSPQAAWLARLFTDLVFCAPVAS